jgi:hypothetical protein
VLSARLERRAGEVIDLRYELRTGRVFLAPAQIRPLGLSSFATRLHTSRNYPDASQSWTRGVRTLRMLRALFVDIMAALMCFWALSGLTMWWVQLRTLRLAGYIVLTTSVAITALVWWGMYLYFLGLR